MRRSTTTVRFSQAVHPSRRCGLGAIREAIREFREKGLLTAAIALALVSVSTSWALDPSSVFEADFDDGGAGWYADNGVWQIGEATVGPVGSGQLAGTVLSGNYPYGAYSRLISPSIALPASPRDGALWLRFSQWFNLHTSDGTDTGRVQLRVGPSEPWIDLADPIWGWSPYWSEFMVDLAAYAGQSVQIAFLMDDNDGSSFGSAESHGWYVDNIKILEGVWAELSLHTFDTFDPATTVEWRGWYASNGCWAIGDPTNGPVSTRSGRHCAATNLSGNYSYRADSRLISPAFDLPVSPADGQIWLSFWSWSNMSPSDGIDYGQVEIQVAGGSWETLPGGFDYWAACWSPCALDISSYAGQTVRVAFRMVDVDGNGFGSSEYQGWYVDDVAIHEGRRWLNNIDTCEGTITGWASTEGVWQLGTPTSGPNVAHSGNRCWATRLDGNYGYLTRSSLQSTWIDLPVTAPLELRFWHWFSFSGSDGVDYGYVSVDHSGGTTTVAGNFTGASSGWSQYIVDLSAYAGQTIRINFRMVDVDGNGFGSSESSGWYLDDFEFVGLPKSQPAPPQFLDVVFSANPPVVQYFADPTAARWVCIYASRESGVIPDLGNRIAVLPAGYGTFVDSERPRYRHSYSITAVDSLGHESVILGPDLTDVGENEGVTRIPRVDLRGARPNPFNPSTSIEFSISEPGHVVLDVYDPRGRLVRQLLDERMSVGKHSVSFEGRRLASGVYLVRLRVGDAARTCKMILAK